MLPRALCCACHVSARLELEEQVALEDQEGGRHGQQGAAPHLQALRSKKRSAKCIAKKEGHGGTTAPRKQQQQQRAHAPYRCAVDAHARRLQRGDQGPLARKGGQRQRAAQQRRRLLLCARCSVAAAAPRRDVHARARARRTRRSARSGSGCE